MNKYRGHSQVQKNWACVRKVRSSTREEAEARAARTDGSRVWRVYKCEFCDGWHVTSKGATNAKPVLVGPEEKEEQ